jgi:hypothetical protein
MVKIVNLIGFLVCYVAVSASGFVVLDAIYPADPVGQLHFEYNRELITGVCVILFSVILGQGTFALFANGLAD